MGRKVVEFRLAADDISAIRFGISPGYELAQAVRTLQVPAANPLQWGWLRVVRDRVPAGPFAVLSAIVGPDGYLPDFLTASPTSEMSAEDELERLRAVTPERLRYDLAKVAARSEGRRRELVEALRLEPERSTREIAAAWEAFWAAVMAPYWPQLERLLRADIQGRARRMSSSGVAAVIGSLHPTVHWGGDRVLVELRKHGEVFDCRGTGLVLVPTVLSSGIPGVLTELPEFAPTLFYPVAGISEDWMSRDAGTTAALTGLLGAGRARVLLALAEPATTSDVAAACSIAVSTASHHLAALSAASLVDSRRDGPRVLHSRTLLGETLVGNG